ncbi:hypothetical protein A1Q1_01044 [Trichosporon asahii var. asahii CBS 2479]|uniref:Uncharacterized protein n=1 Tax=Trichosporon asahii var. asahii (strain ATCC 90039 / CBS 2479 / JCM 2466 / KCTC 7840 / NBRC 103889/ NCYC 2677 / UAMH 7654) TaxID=1186058 RepID=J5QYS2_TRIAS|nr:hypothetical protein A1Q1_01044 [Trichosporon asahii var. asahii CBS 2479]EJT49818.1 hypothetical protein A1Q1_01044 [Trichosporon asahii var. asahii CBS 2479]
MLCFTLALLFVAGAAALPLSSLPEETVQVETRGPPVFVVAGLAVTVAQAVTVWEGDDKESRNQFTASVIDRVHESYPDCNAFIYHIGEDTFTYEVPADAAKEEVSIDHGGFLGWFGVREHYEIVVFDGPGKLERRNSDGGYLNWAFVGWYEVDDDKRVVTFSAPPDDGEDEEK